MKNLGVVKTNYPTEQHSIESTLISMLAEPGRSWHNRCEIHSAIYRVRMHAKSMQEEQRFLEEEQACNPSKEG